MACGRRFVISPAKARRYGFGSELVVVGVTLLAWGGAGSTLATTMERLAQGAEILTVLSGEDAPFGLGEIDFR